MSMDLRNGLPARKSLAEQIDRLDRILDGLAEALHDSITDAARAGSQVALTELFRDLRNDPVGRDALRATLAGPPASVRGTTVRAWGTRLASFSSRGCRSGNRLIRLLGSRRSAMGGGRWRAVLVGLGLGGVVTPLAWQNLTVAVAVAAGVSGVAMSLVLQPKRVPHPGT